MRFNAAAREADKMVKAVFLDYQGTMLQMGGKDLEEMVQRCVKNSRAEDPGEMIHWWFETLHKKEEAAYQDKFETEEELCLEVLQKAVEKYGLKDNFQQLQQLNINYWMYGPLFSDVAPFLQKCHLPVYIISNNSDKYIKVNLKRNDLHVNGYVCGDMVRAYKPHKEMFVKALQISQCSPGEVIHIGDSMEDMEGAQAAGITPVFLDRRKKGAPQGFKSISTLEEALRLL